MPSSDQSVFSEPHMRSRGFRPDPSDRRVDGTLGTFRGKSAPDDGIEHSVWDEPGISHDFSGPVPDGELTYASWLEKRRNETTIGKSWLVACAVALLAGPWAVLGAFWGQGQTAFSVVMIVVFAPVVEETMKVSAALYIVEKKPFLFRTAGQIALCSVMSGLVFATLENLLYLRVYIPDASPGLAAWRWTVCTAMHTFCSLIAGLGVMRIWQDLWRRKARPRLALSFPFAMAAIVVHGGYNALVVLLEGVWEKF